MKSDCSFFLSRIYIYIFFFSLVHVCFQLAHCCLHFTLHLAITSQHAATRGFLVLTLFNTEMRFRSACLEVTSLLNFERKKEKYELKREMKSSAKTIVLDIRDKEIRVEIDWYRSP